LIISVEKVEEKAADKVDPFELPDNGRKVFITIFQRWQMENRLHQRLVNKKLKNIKTMSGANEKVFRVSKSSKAL
jgi:hypothetical protein